MSNYTPDNWVVIKVTSEEYGTVYKILAGWSGGYTTGDSWRMNSGITEVEEDDMAYYFFGSSGITYRCGKGAYTLRMNNAHIWAKLQELDDIKVELMPEDTDWANVDWILSK